MPLTPNLEAVVLATRAVKARDLPHWEAACPSCDQPEKLWLDAYSDGEATVFCMTGRCSALDLVAALGLPTSVEVATATSQVHVLGAPVTRSEILLPHSHRVAGDTVADAAATFGALVIGRDDLAHLPVLEPLIADTISRRTLAFVSGPPGTGKSFLLLDWAARIATGLPWQGRSIDKGRVLYIAAEGAFGIHSRLVAWEEDTGTQIPSDALRIYGDAVQITEPVARQALLDHVAAEDYDLVILDTLARCSVGLDENSPQDMGRFIAAADEVKNAMSNGTVVIVHHSSKAGAGLRGSSVIEGAADTVYTTSRTHGNGLTLSRKKNKNGPPQDEHSFILRPVGPSVVLWKPPGEDDPDAELSPDVFKNPTFRTWTWLQGAFGAGEQTFSRAEAKAVMRSVDEVDRLAPSTFHRHFTTLVDDGLIVSVSPEGTARPLYEINLARGYEFSIPMRSRLALTERDEAIPDGPVFDITKASPLDPRE